LPITTGPRPGVADYLPAPHGLRGFANPVDQIYPSLVPFIEMADGRVVVAADCADEIYPAADGRSLRAIWRRWAVVGGKAGELVDLDLIAEVNWRLTWNGLIRDEKLQVKKDVKLRRWWLAIPTTATAAELEIVSGQRWDRLNFGESKLSVSVTADWPFAVSLKANGDDVLGRGARGPIPLQLVYEARELKLSSRRAVQWQVVMNLE